MKVPQIRRTKAADEVFKTLHEWIMSKQLKQGDILPSQDELARQFGVSRNTLREAIYKLAVSGLLTPKQGIGTVVNITGPSSYMSALSDHLLLDHGTVKDFLEARFFVEKTVVRLAAARVSEAEIAAMETLLEQQLEAFRENDVEAFVELDSLFHMALARASGNKVFLKFLEAIQELLHKFIAEVSQLPGALESALRFHQEILNALRCRDGKKAENKISQHLHDVAVRIERCTKIDIGLEHIFGH